MPARSLRGRRAPASPRRLDVLLLLLLAVGLTPGLHRGREALLPVVELLLLPLHVLGGLVHEGPAAPDRLLLELAAALRRLAHALAEQVARLLARAGGIEEGEGGAGQAAEQEGQDDTGRGGVAVVVVVI